MTIKFGPPETKESRKDKHVYATSAIMVDGVRVGYVTRHSEVLFGVGLPRPHGKGLVWAQFASRTEAQAYVLENAEKALAFLQAGTAVQAVLGL